jgi:hypothetical protein
MTMNIFLVTVLALAGFALLQLTVTALRQGLARKAFHRYLKAARAAGAEEAFMARFNSTASYGDSLDKMIQGWGAAKIRRMYEEAVTER